MSTQNLPALTPEDKKFAESSLERAKIQAACYLPTLLETLADRALDPAATNKTILDAAEFTYRVSGMAKKQEEQRASTGFSITINLPGGQAATIGSAKHTKVVEEAPFLDLPFTKVDSGIEMSDDLLSLLDDQTED